MQRYIFLLAAAALLSAGCGAQSYSSGFAPAATSRGWRSPDASGGDKLLYVSVLSPYEVLVYKQNGDDKPIGEITQGLDYPWGMFVDNRRNLYVANAGNGTVTVYPPGSTVPSATLTDAGAPTQVTVGRDGTVYVAQYGSISDPGKGSVLEYRPGQTTPSKTIISFTKAGEYPTGVALDSSNNLYVAFNRPCIGCNHGSQQNRRGAVLRFSRGASKAKDLGIRVDDAEDLIIDDKDNLILGVDCTVVQDPCYPWSRLYVYPPGGNVPSRELLIASGAVTEALNYDNNEIWITSPRINCPPCSVIQAATYPSGKIVKTFDSLYNWELGIATSPDGSH